MQAILITVLAILAQAGADDPEVLPVHDDAGLQTYVITLEDEGELYGTYETTATQITIYADAPWLKTPPERRTLLTKLRGEPHEELPQRRQERRVRQAKEAGYAYVETPAGAFFVKQDTKRFAERAAALAKGAREQIPAALPPSAAPMNTTQADTPEASAPSNLGRYGWYAAILGTGLLLLGVVVRKLILAD